MSGGRVPPPFTCFYPFSSSYFLPLLFFCLRHRDFAFYGNKLFQGKFIKIINPTASLFQILLWTCLNSLVALVGYYFAAFTIDKPWMGRTRMQAQGFLWIGFLFLMCELLFCVKLRAGHYGIAARSPFK